MWKGQSTPPPWRPTAAMRSPPPVGGPQRGCGAPRGCAIRGEVGAVPPHPQTPTGRLGCHLQDWVPATNSSEKQRGGGKRWTPDESCHQTEIMYIGCLCVFGFYYVCGWRVHPGGPEIKKNWGSRLKDRYSILTLITESEREDGIKPWMVSSTFTIAGTEGTTIRSKIPTSKKEESTYKHHHPTRYILLYTYYIRILSILNMIIIIYFIIIYYHIPHIKYV